jgi:hypothetical protein
MTSIKLLHVSARGCRPQGVLQIKGTQSQHAKLDYYVGFVSFVCRLYSTNVHGVSDVKFVFVCVTVDN